MMALKRVFKLIISLGVYYADRAVVMVAGALGKPVRGSCVVLYYHEVTTSDRERFAAQIDVICREATPICALDSRKFENGKRYVAFTVDDAFISFFQNGLPELELRSVPVTVFVPTAWLGQRVDWAMEEVMASPNERIATLTELKQFAGNSLLRFASHTVNHRKLSGLSEAEARTELSESKAFLEHELGGIIDAVSFPYGGFTRRDLNLAAQLGYKTFFSTTPRVNHHLGEGLIGRFRLDPADWLLEAKLKAAGAYRWQTAFRYLH